MSTEDRSLNYPVLLAVIIIGVTAGNLLSSWIAAKVIEHGIEEAVNELNSELNFQLQNAQKESVEQRVKARAASAALAESVQNQRRQDRTGIKLGQICNDWRKSYEELSSYTSRTESEKHCVRLNKYIQTGSVPP